MSLDSRTLAIVVNDPGFFLSHRLNIALRARDLGMKVTVITPPGAAVRDIENAGLQWRQWDITRWGANPFVELRAVADLAQIFRSIRPDIVHLVTIKPVLYGSLVARLLKIRGRVSAISGLGQVFTASGFKASLRRAAVKSLYRISLGGKNSRVIFQNEDDKAAFLGSNLIRESQAVLIRGAGVDTHYFVPAEKPARTPTILFASRLLVEKGIRDFMEAARKLHARGLEARFLVAGAPVPGNPASVSEAEFETWRQHGIVEFAGYQKDMLSYFHDSDIAVLPSYYGEGIPKFLIEAASCQLAIVTTDWPGCRDIVKHGENGLLVPPRDADALADALEELILNREKREAFGKCGRERVLQEGFSQDVVVESTIRVYRELQQ